MRTFVGLDVSLKSTSVCVVDASGTMIKQTVLASEPEALISFLAAEPGIIRIGLESSSLAMWLYGEIAKAGLPIICIEARHASRILGARLNKTDQNDALGIAEIMRTGLYRAVHYKTPESQAIRAFLTTRRLLLDKLTDVENGLRGILLPFGLKLGRVTRRKYAGHIRLLVEAHPEIASVMSPLLAVWEVLYLEVSKLDRRARLIAAEDPVCRRLMSAPGVGHIVALIYRSVIDQPGRFRHSRTVGAHIGLTPKAQRSGNMQRQGRISRCGDRTLRTALFSAARVILNPRIPPFALQKWGMAIAERRGKMRAYVAVARRLAVILHRMWIDETEFRLTENPA